MSRIYCLKNNAKTASEKFRKKSEFALFNYVVLRYTLRLWTVVLYSCVIFSQSLQSLKGIPIDFHKFQSILLMYLTPGL